MNTVIINENEIDIAAKIIKSGGLVAMPTETVYGLAANAFDENAIKKIYTAKGRPSDNPLIVHISEFEEIYSLVQEVPKNAKILAKKFWPGPLTIILKKSDKISNVVSGGLDTVAIRLPSSECARKLIKSSGVPIAAPSANISGRPSPTTFDHVKNDMMGKIECIIKGEKCSVGVESTVLTLAEDVPTILRPGGVTYEQLKSVIGEVKIASAVLNPLGTDEKAASPGMKYKHYAPKSKVVILKGSTEKFINYINSINEKNLLCLCFDETAKKIQKECICYGSKDDSLSQAQALFDALRKSDDYLTEIIYAQCPSLDGVGLAVYNRLIRAAGFEVIDLEKI